MARRQPVLATRGNVGRRPLETRRFASTHTTMDIPAPVGGWNARDSLSQMRPTDAVELINWFPRQSDMVTRPGTSLHCATGENANVEQVMAYEHGGTSKLLAAVNGKIFDVTTSIASSLDTGFGSNLWSNVMFKSLLFMANGEDAVRTYDGSSLATPSFSGPTVADLIYVTVYKSRLYFIEKESTSIWYGATGAVSGTLTEFDFAGVTSLRGHLMIVTHLKGDGGDGGQDDIFIAIFSEGDVLAYVGSDPGDPNNWQLLGHYRMARPLSRFGIVESEDDIYLITARGYVKLSEVLKSGAATPDRYMLSSRIQQAVTAQIANIGVSTGWRMMLHPRGQMLVVTVPGAAEARHYHVRNINTGAWARFQDFMAFSWTLLGAQPYFGGEAGGVYKFDDGSVSDEGEDSIHCSAQPAWNTLRMPGRNKRVQFIKPYFRCEAAPVTRVSLGVDYGLIGGGEFTDFASPNYAVWDEAEWDVDEWATGDDSFAQLFPQNAVGNAIGFRIEVNTSTFEVRWHMTTVIYSAGGLK